MAEIELRQVRSAIKTSHRQRDTLRSLKLGRPGHRSTVNDTPEVRGMIRSISHMVEVAEGGESK